MVPWNYHPLYLERNWVSARALGTGERWFRGALAPLDIIPGAAAVKKYSHVSKINHFTEKLDILGKTTALTNKARSDLQKTSELMRTASKEAAARLKNADAVMKDRIAKVPPKLADGALASARVVDETIKNTKNFVSDFMPNLGVVTVDGVSKIPATNTHIVENIVQSMIKDMGGLNIDGNGITDLAKASGKDYPKVKLDEVVASGFDESGKLKERWIVPKGFDSVEDFLKTVDDVSIKDYGYDSIAEFTEVVESVNIHLNGAPKNNIINKGLAGGTHVKGVDYDLIGFPIFKGDDVKFTTRLDSDLLIATDHLQFTKCTNTLRDAIERGEVLRELFTPKQIEQIVGGEPRIYGLTWHHHQVTGKMQLVISDTHSVSHLGGNKLWGGGVR